MQGDGIDPLSKFLRKSVNRQVTLIWLMCHHNQPLRAAGGTPSPDLTAWAVHGAGNHLVHRWHVPAHRGSESHSCSGGVQPWCILHQLGSAGAIFCGFKNSHYPVLDFTRTLLWSLAAAKTSALNHANRPAFS